MLVAATTVPPPAAPTGASGTDNADALFVQDDVHSSTGPSPEQATTL